SCGEVFEARPERSARQSPCQPWRTPSHVCSCTALMSGRDRMQRPTHARIPPVDPVGMNEQQRALAGVGASNVSAPWAPHDELLQRCFAFGKRRLFSTRLTPKERELMGLRVALRPACEYEWANHVLAARAAGATSAELRALHDDVGHWPPPQAALLQTVDELCADDSVSDATWAELTATGDEQRWIEVLFLIG